MFFNRWHAAIAASGVVVLCLIIPSLTLAYDKMGPDLRAFSGSGSLLGTLPAYASNFKGGVSVATGNIDGVGKEEIIVGAGPGGGPQIRILRNGDFIKQFFAFDGSTNKGINVAAGDVDGDGYDEVIVSHMAKADSLVQIYDVEGSPTKKTEFYAYAPDFDGGVTLSVGDVDGDGKAEIITGTEDKAMQVRIFDISGTNASSFRGFFAFDGYRHGGVYTAPVDYDGNGKIEAIALAEAHADGNELGVVRLYGIDGSWSREFLPYGSTYRGGITIATGDYNNDGSDELIFGTTTNGPNIQIYTRNGYRLGGFFAYDGDYGGGVNVAVAETNGQGEIVTLPMSGAHKRAVGENKQIVVNLAEQRLYAYESDRPVKSFLISSGTWHHPTPPGNYNIQRKVYNKLYENHVPGDEYYLPNTLWNMQFTPGYYLHGAYWHNNFGHPMSHGCINIAYPDAEWIYNWAEVGTPVQIH